MVLFYKLEWIMGKVMFDTKAELNNFKDQNEEILKKYELKETEIGY
jgi:hypothetical protein